MEINPSILSYLHQSCNYVIDSYTKPTKNKTKETIESLVKELYGLEGKHIQNIKWIHDDNFVEEQINKSKTPWVYHYDLNIHWILFFKNFYEGCLRFNEDSGCKFFIEESGDIYKKVLLLEKILQNIDGITELDENNGTIYLVDLDISFIKKNKLEFILN